MTDTLTITRPDDWHLHVRDGAALAAVVPASVRQFGRALIMPNLKPPVTTAALALAYFALEHLPDELVNIPLEYFETALHWLQRQPAIRGDQLAVLGGSKGGELGLLLGGLYPQLKAVIVYVPSSIVWNGVFRGQEDPDQLASSWSWRGEPLPFVSRAPMRLLQEQIERDEAISLLKEALARETVDAHRYLADAYAALGREEESRAHRAAYDTVKAARLRRGAAGQ